MEITPLHLATLDLPEDHPEYPGEDRIHAFLIDAGKDLILVDTGVGAGNSYIDKTYAPRRMDLVAALASHAYKPEDVSKVVNSHLHFDHCGNNSLFPAASFFATQVEYDDAKQDRYTVQDWFDFPEGNWTLILDRIEIAEGIELLPTPGHTRGHLSVLIRDGSGLHIIAAQAIYTSEECTAALAGSSAVAKGNWNDDAYRRSRQILFDLNPERMFFSHDSRTWEKS